MNSSVTLLSDTSVMSISCLEMRVSRRSNGPLKWGRLTENPPSDSGTASSPAGDVSPRSDRLGFSPSNSAAALRDGATGDQLSRQLPIGLRRGMLGGKCCERFAGDTRIREFHGATDDRFENVVAEGVDDAFEDLT